MAARKTQVKKPIVNQILEQRKRTHGPFHNFAKASMELKTVCRNTVVGDHCYETMKPEHQEVLDMLCHKMARILTGDPNHKDHWDDIAGYATRAAEACE